MQEDIVENLTSFGFTVNQAKVYLSIVQSGKTRVGRISRNTQLHRQDIYKLLPKLEKMGLITKTIDKPFMIEAIPIDKALESLISKEKEKANRKITDLETHLKEMVAAIQQQPHLKEEARFMLLTNDEAIKNRGYATFRKIKREFRLVSDMEYIMSVTHHLRDFMFAAAGNNVKTRMIIVGPEDKAAVKQIIEKITPPKSDFIVKQMGKNACKNFQIVDNKEVWIATQQKTESGFPGILWTNDSNLVDAYQESFRQNWSNKNLVTIYRSKALKGLAPQVNNPPLTPMPA
jgi:sugar-specific transcriptional regulator TrmB